MMQVLGRPKQKDHKFKAFPGLQDEFKARLGKLERFCFGIKRGSHAGDAIQW